MKMKLLSVLSCVAFWSFSQANATTYNVNINLPIGPGNVSGFIETDGSLGPLTAADIVDWSLLLTIGASNATLTGPLSGNNSQVDFFGSPALSATATQLLFDFSTSLIEVDYIQFVVPPSPFVNFFCINACASHFAIGVGDLRAFALAQGEVVIGTTSEVPLPATLPLLGSLLGVGALLGWRKRRKALA